MMMMMMTMRMVMMIVVMIRMMVRIAMHSPNNFFLDKLLPDNFDEKEKPDQDNAEDGEGEFNIKDVIIYRHQININRIK